MGSKRTPDPGKICAACGVRFYRHETEHYNKYKERITCGRHCAARIRLHGKTKFGRNAECLPAEDFSCTFCTHFYEDSEIGTHCGSCTSGQMFYKDTKFKPQAPHHWEVSDDEAEGV
jgi:hypothetical protein